MSDELAVSESAPTSTSDIAASVIETAEREDSSGESGEVRQSYEAPQETAQVQAPITEAELSAAAKFLIAQGHKAKKEDGRDNWLPVKTVERMLDRYQAQHKTGWDGERSALERDRDDHRGQVEKFRSLLAGDETGFLKAVAEIDPRYARYLEAKAEAQAEPDPEPEPDYDLGNGQKTYSLEGLRQREAWQRRQLQREIADTLKPYADREQQQKDAAETERVNAELRENYRQIMQEAQTWPEFGTIAPDGKLTAFQQEVADELKKDTEQAQSRGQRPTMTVRQAFLEVKARRDAPEKVRERVLEELKTAPRSPSLTRQTPDATRSAKPRSTADIARQMIREAEA